MPERAPVAAAEPAFPRCCERCFHAPEHPCRDLVASLSGENAVAGCFRVSGIGSSDSCTICTGDTRFAFTDRAAGCGSANTGTVGLRPYAISV